ncbi:MAG: cell filamentation protein Fic [Spiribacter salinus]|uniref:protein adenylyltransferase n=1 Tax=Spiribacter salinus TaxID=1335746 RepID=A0A540VPB6_9GAMM|nr:Fic family protein [Thioalkalivibrio sp. ALMg13-2]TQE98614.1 MAG: cell filamentation protein Fic [Spiribacter salinus]
MSRYRVTGPQGGAEPGSDGRVLVNKLGITDQKSLDEAEAELLLMLYEAVFADLREDRPLDVALLKHWHRRWLGSLYDWAGEERQVNLQKGGFMFAAAQQIPHLLQALDQKWLQRLTPCCGMDDDAALRAIAEIHVELILIHPFREGNGRIARLLADAMAYQAGIGLLDYSDWDQNKSAYIAAIHAGLEGDYQPMVERVRRAAAI